MVARLRVVHCINQFFAGIGGEEAAGMPPQLLPGPRGPGVLLQSLAPDLVVTATVAFGDNDVAARTEAAVAQVLTLLRGIDPPDLVIAGPAFAAGRYGIACAAICRAVREQLGIPALTALHPDNPAVDAYRRDVPIVRAERDVIGMRDALRQLLAVGRKLVRGEVLDPVRDGLLTRGVRKNAFAETTGAERAVTMLSHKVRGAPFETEYPMPVFDRVAPAPPVAELASATIALVTSGGIVPRGNPDHIESANASRYGEYSLAGIAALSPDTHETVHGGYDPTYANADPNRVLPVDALRALEREGRIGRLYPRYFATVGNGTSVDRARRFGEEIATRLVNAGVQAVLVTSTWGTCTRCGATIAKEIERAGLPAAHICSIVPISRTVGANRIVPSVAIPHPLGDPELPRSQEQQLRRRLVERALAAVAQPIEAQRVFT